MAISATLTIAVLLLNLLITPTAWAVELSESEKASLLSFGPWPPVPERDRSNRFSGNPKAAHLGQRLFFDKGLSGDGKTSCATCHVPEQGWARNDKGAGALGRNIPTAQDQVGNRWFGWDGAADNLWAQSLRPVLDPAEMHNSIQSVARYFRSVPEYTCAYREVTGKSPPADDETLAVDIAKLLAAFQETLVSPRTPFDDFRDALEKGDQAAAARYPVEARRGLVLFLGKGNCSVCHFGATFSNREFHDLGVPHFVKPGQVDPGRYGGIQALRESRFNLAGRHSDDPEKSGAEALRHVDLLPRNFGEFKVPGLRSLKFTAPYMHNGHLADLPAVVRFYSELNEERLHADGEKLLRPLNLSNQEITDLAAFLESLSAAAPIAVPALPQPRSICRN